MENLITCLNRFLNPRMKKERGREKMRFPARKIKEKIRGNNTTQMKGETLSSMRTKALRRVTTFRKAQKIFRLRSPNPMMTSLTRHLTQKKHKEACMARTKAWQISFEQTQPHPVVKPSSVKSLPSGGTS